MLLVFIIWKKQIEDHILIENFLSLVVNMFSIKDDNYFLQITVWATATTVDVDFYSKNFDASLSWLVNIVIIRYFKTTDPVIKHLIWQRVDNLLLKSIFLNKDQCFSWLISRKDH